MAGESMRTRTCVCVCVDYSVLMSRAQKKCVEKGKQKGCTSLAVCVEKGIVYCSVGWLVGVCTTPEVGVWVSVLTVLHKTQLACASSCTSSSLAVV